MSSVHKSEHGFNVSAFESAMGLLDRGITPIPLEGKTPPKGFPLRGCFETMPTASDVRQWFIQSRARNVGAVMGAVSGGVAVRDWDDASAFHRWADDHAELSSTLPITRTSRGFHVWFWPDPGEVRDLAGGRSWLKFDDGELRLDSCYVVAPSSVHPETGTTYSWERDLDGLAYVSDLRASGLIPSGTHEVFREFGTAVESLGDAAFGVPKSLEDAIRLTRPNRPGNRHRQIFEFVRALRAMPEFQNRDPRDLQHEFDLWWRTALPAIGTKDWQTSWFDFVDGWRLVRTPWGSAAICQAFSAAEGDGIERLSDACRRISAANGGQPFFLATRTAARMLNAPHRTAARWLNQLVEGGVLAIVEKGRNKDRKATVFSYRGDA